MIFDFAVFSAGCVAFFDVSILLIDNFCTIPVIGLERGGEREREGERRKEREVCAQRLTGEEGRKGETEREGERERVGGEQEGEVRTGRARSLQEEKSGMDNTKTHMQEMSAIHAADPSQTLGLHGVREAFETRLPA